MGVRGGRGWRGQGWWGSGVVGSGGGQVVRVVRVRGGGGHWW